MIQHSVVYWHTPEAVLWVDLPHRRLQGFDHYWLAGDRYGVWNDPENMGTMYEGAQGFAWKWTDGVEVELDDWTPPADALQWHGVMIPDDDARAVGLI